MQVKRKKVFYIILMANVFKEDSKTIKNNMDFKLMINNYIWVILRKEFVMVKVFLKLLNL